MAYDSKKITAVKDAAEVYFSNGNLNEALEAYESIRSYSSKDPRILLRIGDIRRKLGENDDAIEAYKLAVNTFITQGFITKAIGVCKIIMDIDPSQESVQKRSEEQTSELQSRL